VRAVAIISLILALAVGFVFFKKIGFTKSPQPAAVAGGANKTNTPAGKEQGFYLGKGDQQVFINYGTPDPVVRSFMRSVMENSSDPNAQGREIFQRICAACHQKGGEGKDGVAPPLAGSEWVNAPSGEAMVRIVLNGLKGPVHVSGRDWNLLMPPWRENLDDDQIAVVLTFIRSQLSGNNAGPVTPEFVAAQRQNAPSVTETAASISTVTNR
jgi:mono/diheme cytochrome c family protein